MKKIFKLISKRDLEALVTKLNNKLNLIII
jgi:hypothetical protein